MVLITKGDSKEFRGIGIVEVMWKSTSSIINQYLILEILYYETLHGFWMRRGMGTATVKSELIQQITAIR